MFNLSNAKQNQVPILISVPHCGIEFPNELKDQYKKNLASSPEDTDWFVDQLYDFAPSMGMTMISAIYSRWVIDLNRDPKSKPLYSDGRIITGLCPTTNFLGEPIYKDEREAVDEKEIKRRLDQYYLPYHSKIYELLTELKSKFGKVLLWDCHSIRQYVPTIHHSKFPDLILGDADGTSADPSLSKIVLKHFAPTNYSHQHNSPFKGGTITRHFGKPEENQHALQLEMTKVNYMDDAEKKYDDVRAEKMRAVLKGIFEDLIQQLKTT
ncbi:MAG TPA: N-formylglutamate amidohydrolase [Chryseolinea sp.]|nr:N-formylglutamate amidohydrolase [Chryseolinea sp.]